MRFILILIASLVLPTSLQAASLRVNPVRVVLSGAHPIAAITVTNTGDALVWLQMRLVAWSQSDGEDQFAPTRDILANPSIFKIAPGAEQIIRLGLQSAAVGREGSYRVFLEELPQSAPEHPNEVRTLLRISIPVFTPAKDGSARIAWRLLRPKDGAAYLWFHNEGERHVQINGVTLTDDDGHILEAQNMSLYVLPGAWRRARLDAREPLPSGEHVNLHVAADQDGVVLRPAAEAEAHGPGAD